MAEELIGEQEAEEPQGMRLVVELINGNTKVTGPINDRGLCYMLLELAKDAIREHGYRLAAQQRQERQALSGLMTRDPRKRQ